MEFPLLAVDYGKKRVGIAISDRKGLVASPLAVLLVTPKRGQDGLIADICELATQYRAEAILVGRPQVFVESHKKIVREVDQFIEELQQKTNLHIYTTDESFSTSKAQNMLLFFDKGRKRKKAAIDKYASAVFLQDYLDQIARSGSQKQDDKRADNPS